MEQGQVIRRSRRTRRTNLSIIITILATAAATVLGSGGVVAAQDDGGAGAGPASLTILDQTTFVAADGQLDLVLAVRAGAAAADDPVLSVTIYGLLVAEDEVDEPLTQTPINRLDPIALDELTTDEAGNVRLAIPVRSGPPFDGVDRVLLQNPGVYPVVVELRTEDGPVAAARTHLVRLAKETSETVPAGQPLPVAIVLGVTTAEGLTVVDAERLLLDHPATPATIVLQDGVINQLKADQELAARFAVAVAGRPVIAVPPIDLDPSALAEIDQSDLYAEAASAVIDDLRRLGLSAATDVAVVPTLPTWAGARLENELGVRSVLDTSSRSGGTGRLAGQGFRLQIVRFDAELTRTLGGSGQIAAMTGGVDAGVRANRVLAKLTLRGEVDDGPVVIGGPELGTRPGPALDAFFRGLNQPGAPQPILVSDIDGGPTIRPAERPDQDLEPVAPILVAVQEQLATYDTFYQGGGASPDHYRAQMLAGLTRERNPGDRIDALTAVAGQLEADLSVIELHHGQPVTLAARSAPIPIVVESRARGPRQVMLRFNSDKVVARDDQQVVVIQPGTSSIDVELETRSLGVSPLEVSIWTPDGATRLATTRFEVRSTAVPGLGLLVSVGAVALLGAWWIVDLRKRRALAAGPAGTARSADPDPPA